MATRLHVSVVSGSVMAALAGSGCTDTAPAPPRLTPIATEPEQLIRLRDFSPVSEANPVVARIVDTPIVIPMSEFRAYLSSELSEEERTSLDPNAARTHLERLIDELVLLRDAYRKNVDASEPIASALEGTRRMLLAEFLTREEVGDKAKSAEQYSALLAALEDRLFEEAEIVVSNEAYAVLKEAVTRYGPGKPDELPAGLAARQLAVCGDMKVTIGDVLSMYLGLTPGKRPDITTPEVLAGLLKELLADGLKVAEARKRRLDRGRLYRETVAANRAALTRMWLQDRITDEAVEQMKAKPSVRSDYLDIVRERVRASWAGRLREGLKVEIDAQLVAAASASGEARTR